MEFDDRSSDEEDHIGVLVLRAWLADGRLHARILCSRDGGEDRRVFAAVGRQAIEARVAAWLAELGETEP